MTTHVTTHRRPLVGPARRVVGMLGLSLIALTVLATSTAQDCALLRVTIHNENKGQNFSPSVVLVHNTTFSLFTIGDPASRPLWRLAEDGASDDFLALVDDDPDVSAVSVAPRAHRKRSPKVATQVKACAGDRLSIAAMLGATNDGFVAARDVAFPGAPGIEVRATLHAFDAGSEANTESCDHVPCKVHGIRMPEGAEGTVQPHAGIRGDADIPAARGWDRDVLGRVVVERVAPTL